jgi:uncharacterized membrane protein
MFLTLLLTTFAIATAVSIVVAVGFRRPVHRILVRIIGDDLSSAWSRYLMFALFVVGISSGVRVWDLEKYVTKPPLKDAEIVQLTQDRWILEIYRTVIGTLQGLAWVLLVFFVIALFAFVLVRLFELRRTRSISDQHESESASLPAQHLDERAAKAPATDSAPSRKTV